MPKNCLLNKSIECKFNPGVKLLNLKCTCGSTDLRPMKFGGDIFRVSEPEKTVLLRTAGYIPDVWLCNSCRQILFSLKDEDFNKLK